MGEADSSTPKKRTVRVYDRPSVFQRSWRRILLMVVMMIVSTALSLWLWRSVF
jgi:membrane protein required for beta-lactamase induction